jgi:hypothetical protein
MAAALLGVCACETNVGTAGCQITLEVPLAGSPLTLLPDARLDVVGDGFFLVGSDGTNVMWASLAANGVLGAQQMLAIPAGASATVFAFAQTDAPADTLLVGVVIQAANGTDAELHIIAAHANGSVVASNPAVVTFPGGVATPPMLAMATSRQGVTADLAWVVDAGPGQDLVMLASVDGQGQLSGQVTVDPTPAAASNCLGFSLGANADLVVSFLRYDTPGGVPTWEKVERTPAGGVSGLKLMVASASPTMGCAIGLPLTSGYALAWQDNTGSWLSIDDMTAGGTGSVLSFPFASATDFGGPDLQPPIVGLAPFAGDYGVLFSGARAVELWRLGSTGVRSPGKLVFPSLEGNLGKVSAAWVGGSLAATYADYGTVKSQRWLVDAACY